MRYFLLLLVLGSSARSLQAQANGPKRELATCRQAVVQAYDQLKATQAAAKDRIQVVRLQTSTKEAGSSNAAPGITQMIILKRGTQTLLSAGQTDFFQDGEHQVVINRAQKTILITPQRGGAQTGGVEPWLQFRDQFLAQTQVSSCELVAQGKQRLIRFIPRVDGTLTGKMASVEYRLDAATNNFQSMTVNYLTGSALVYSTMKLLAQEWKHADPRVDLPAIRQVQDAQQRLLPIYRGYTVQDLRPKSRP